MDTGSPNLLMVPILPVGDAKPPPQDPKPAATQIGEGLPPVPAKLADRILRGEFIEMFEMLLKYMVETKNRDLPRKVRVVVKRRGCRAEATPLGVGLVSARDHNIISK